MWIPHNKIRITLLTLLLLMSLTGYADKTMPDKNLLAFLADMQEMTDDNLAGWLEEDMPLPDNDNNENGTENKNIAPKQQDKDNSKDNDESTETGDEHE